MQDMDVQKRTHNVTTFCNNSVV